MNIAIFTNNYLPNPFGVSGSIESFRKQFERLGHNVYIFAPDYEGYIDENKNVFRFFSIDFGYKISFPLPIPYSPRISKILEDLDIDIVHSQHPNLLGDVAMSYAEKKNIPIVFTWHTLYDRYSNYVPFPFKEISAKWSVENAVEYANKCDAVIIPTVSVKEELLSWGVLNEKMSVISTGVETSVFLGAAKGELKKKMKIGDDKVVLFSASRLTDEKNVEFLLDCVIETLKKNKNTVFLLGGDGYLEEDLKKKVEEEKLGDRIIFLGLVKKEELKNYFADSDIFVYASKSETQGTIVSEAMFCGLPIVALDAPGICNLVEDGKNGFLVQEKNGHFSDAVLKLIDGVELRKQFGKKSFEIANENFTDKVCAEKMLKLYGELIEKNRS